MTNTCVRVKMLCVLLIAAVALVSCKSAPVTEARIVPENAIDPADPNLSVENLEMKIDWRQSVAIGDKRHGVWETFLHRDVFFAETEDAYLFAFSIPDGIQMWMIPLDGPMLFSPAVADKCVYALANAKLCYISKNSGSILKKEPPRVPASALESYKEDLIMGCGDSRVVYFRTASGEHKWNTGVGGAVMIKPLVVGENVICVAMNGGISALSLPYGAQVWKFTPKKSYFTRGVCSDGELVYAIGADAVLYALKAQNGSIDWQFPTGSMASEDPVYVAGKLLVFTYDGGLLCFDPAKKGQEDWAQKRAKKFLAAGLKRLYVLLDGNKLAALDYKSGEIVWERPLPSDALVEPNAYSDSVIIATKNGYVISLKELR